MLARRQPLNTGEIDDLPGAAMVADDLAGRLDAAHVCGRLRSAVDALPDTLRTAFLLVFQESMTHADAARELRVSQEALRARLCRARAQLRLALKDLKP